jgi:hypothetical protein
MAIIITRELPKIESPSLAAGDKRKNCCRQPANLEYLEVSPGMVCHKCRRCGCRHFEMTADPGVIGIKGKSL